MEPADLAGLLAREVDAGVMAALRSVDATGALDVDRIVARVGSGARGEELDWSQVTWQSEFVLRVAHDRRRMGGEGREPLPKRVAALPVHALVGVGKHWNEILHAAGIDTIGQLASLDSARTSEWIRRRGGYAAVLIGRARLLPLQWPQGLPPSLDSRTVLDVVEHGPKSMPGVERGAATAVWEACLTLVACIDHEVLAQLRVGDL